MDQAKSLVMSWSGYRDEGGMARLTESTLSYCGMICLVEDGGPDGISGSRRDPCHRQILPQAWNSSSRKQAG